MENQKKQINREQVELIRSSLLQIHPMADLIAKSFYARLFDVTPHLRKLFTGDMHRQGTMLMTSLELAVSSLDDPQGILPSIQALGERHVSYGVRAEYYQLAKEAYLWSLERHLGDRFTPELKEAWTAAFSELVEAMISAADG